MTLFEWLFIGHLIGDWVLQNDWMARHKLNGLFNRALLLHCTVYTTTLVLVYLLLVGSAQTLSGYVGFAALIYVSHWLIDALGLARWWTRFFRQTDAPFMRIVVDQIMHLVVLALLVEFGF